nr:putative phage minor tail protein [uncultured Mediterranean phage uvMED]
MSTFIRIGQFAKIYKITTTGRKEVVYKYQNAIPNERKEYNAQQYDYLGFIYQGAAKNRTGDNLEANFVLGTNPVSTNLSRELISTRHYAEIATVQFDRDLNITRTMSREFWTVASLTYDAENLELVLSSAIDAVGANAPLRTLSRDMVGNLPVTANISVR